MIIYRVHSFRFGRGTFRKTMLGFGTSCESDIMSYLENNEEDEEEWEEGGDEDDENEY